MKIIQTEHTLETFTVNSQLENEQAIIQKSFL